MTPKDTVVRPLIRDHEEVVIAQVAYDVSDAEVFLGISNHAVRRLIRSGQLRARNTGRSYIIPGKAIIEYLNGADEPMHHRDSA